MKIEELLRQRVVMLGQPIDDEVANVIIAQLLFLQSEDALAPIRLLIASVGGHVAASLAIYDVITESACPVHTHCAGEASGTAPLLLAAGARGSRSAAPSSRIVFTPMSSAVPLTEETSRELLRTEGIFSELLAKATGQPRERIVEDMRGGRTFDAESACAYGLVDRVG